MCFRLERCGRGGGLSGTGGSAMLMAGLLAAAGLAGGAEPEQWGVFEVSYEAPATANPYLDTQIKATFTQGDQSIVVPGFVKAGTTFAVRFSPPTSGEWHYRVASNRPELDGRSGSFRATPPSAGNRGPVVVRDTWYLGYADGTPYHQFGTTCYAWTHQPREMREQTLRTLATSPFNKIRFCVFPKSYVYNANEPDDFAFVRRADGSFDFDQPDPAFWSRFEQHILDLQALGIQADLILWHPYDRWGFAEMSDEQDDRYLRYCIARLGAYRNVWWSLANEFDFMTNRVAGHRGNKQWSDWDRFFDILANEDPHQRLRGIHNGGTWYDHTKPWVTHASIQTSDMAAGLRYREQYRKPVVYDECCYEGNIPHGWGKLTGREMTQRFWLGTLSGCYVGHGETYKHPQDVLWWSKGGVLHGESPSRIQWLRELLAQAPPFGELRPIGAGQGNYRLAKPGAYYLVYCLDQRPRTVSLAGDRPYKVDLLDPWAMTVTPLGTAQPGDYTVAAPRADMAVRLTPYAADERLRPTAEIRASVVEGRPPLAVDFRHGSDGRARWDFGDGATSDLASPSHVYLRPGLYTVTLTVTDNTGASAQAFTSVAVDRDPHQPILRAGEAVGETPGLTLMGTARRSDAAGLLLPDGAPWGWCDAAPSLADDLRGLASFTITGWLRPDSLEVGSGGNRILFCLRRDQAGIDLVCHADGRLRLAVNQWPDAVRCDSSPGRLEVGQWTRFAVTYDGTRAENNVRFCFAPPRAAMGPAQLALDTTVSYGVGPVGADPGPLTVGNFNDTMRGVGLDRQFRGEIRGLQLYGSRAGAAGALDLPTLERLAAPVG